MTTRLATSNYFARNLEQLQRRQVSMDRAQLEISTGKKIVRPSDDPTGANTVIRLQKEIDVSERYIESQNSARRYNNVAETQTESMTNTLFRTQELMTQAINGSLDAGALRALGRELSARGDEFFSQINSKNAAGDYIFSGYQTNTPSYDLDIFGFAMYQGDNGQRPLLVAPNTEVFANDTANSFVDNLESDYGYFEADSDKLSVGVVSDPAEFRSPAFPETTYQIRFNAAGDGYDILDLGLDGPNQLLGTVTNYLPGEPITVKGVSFKTDATNPPVANEVFNVEPQRESEIINYRINFLAGNQYEVVNLDTNRVESGPINYTMGDVISYGGREFPSDPAAAVPVAGTSFDFGVPSKNTHWVMDQAAEATEISGGYYSATGNDVPFRSIDLGAPAGDLFPPSHPLYAAGTTGAMTIPANTGNARLNGGNLIHPDDNIIGDYRLSFLDTTGDGNADTARMDEIDPVTKRIKPRTDGDTYEVKFDPGEKLVIGGVEFDVQGVPDPGDTFEIDRPENSRRTELMSVLLEEIDQGLITTGNTRSAIGARLNIVDNMEKAQLNFQEVSKETLANIEEIDIYEAVNNLESSRLALQAAQQSFAQIQSLSLFNYI